MKIVYKILIIIITIVIFVYTIPPQIEVEASSNDYLKFEHISTAHGLSQNFINCIYQDHYGYMWFGTLSGLNKYDGIQFDIYYLHEVESVDYNSGSTVISIVETHDYKLWVGTTNGLYVFDPNLKTFTSCYKFNSGDNLGISSNRINIIYEDSKGALWIGTAKGLDIFNPETNTFTAYLQENWITSIYETDDNKLWVGSTNGLYVYDIEKEKFITFFKHDIEDPKSISNDRINAIYQDSNRTLWIGTSEGLNVYNPKTNTFTAYFYKVDDSQSISNDAITSLCEYNNNLWIGTRLGLNKLDIVSGIFYSYKNEVDNLDSIKSDRVVSLYKDNQGILWVGTANGLEKLNFKKQAFKYYTGVLDNSNILTISGLNDNTIWLETWGRAIKFNLENHEVVSEYNEIFKDQNYYSSMMNTFCVSKDGMLWIGTGYSGLSKLDPATGLLKNYRSEPGNDDSLLNNSISSIYFDHKGILWIGTINGLCSFDPVTEKFTNYQNNAEYPDAIKNGEIRGLYEDADYNLWFGIHAGVYKIDINTGKIECIMDNSKFVQESADQAVRVIYKDTNGQYWFGTGCGLYRYNPVNKEIIHYGTKNPLLYYTILDILEDDNGDIWLTTRHGLGRLSIENNNYIEYGIKDGLQESFFSSGASYKSEDGELFFGCGGGLISFYPDDIVEDITSPNVVINGFTLVDKQIIFNESIEDIKEINLSYTVNSFEIDFVALSYKSPEYNQYSYKLEGFDKNWNYCSASDSFTKYTNIPSGNYTFRVIASNSDGVWNYEGASLKIIIATPFWKEWWFILVLAVIAVFTVLGLIKFRTQSLHRHTEELKLQVEERTSQLAMKSAQLENELDNRIQFTRALVHELKTPLTAMMGSSELLIEQPLDELGIKLAKNLNRGANNLKRRIDELLDIAKGEMGTLNIQCNTVNALTIVRELVEDITPEVEKMEQNIILDLPCSLPDIYIDSDRLRQILFNIIGNAIKYNSPRGMINISVKQDDNFVVFNIQDQGIGMSPEEQKGLFTLYYRGEIKNERLGGLGIGLALSKTLIEIHGGKIWVKSQKGKGSTFSFSIPIMQSEDYLKI